MPSVQLNPDLNPFSPGSGTRPPELAGRTAELEAFDSLLARSKNRVPARGLMLSGLRGVGKTVLLNEMRAMAERHDWYTIAFEASNQPTQTLSVKTQFGRHIFQLARKIQGTNTLGSGRFTASMLTALSALKSFSLNLGVVAVSLDVEANGRGASGDIAIDLLELVEDLAPVLVEQRRPLGIFIDELQDLDAELLTAILMTQHKASQQRWPFFVTGAGLPTLPSHLSEQVSYTERMFDHKVIGQLDQAAARQALNGPVTRVGGAFADGSLDELVEASGRYPYFIQEFGKHAWENASGRVITLSDTEIAISEGKKALDSGFFPARWGRATPQERKFMAAMATCGGESVKTGDIVSKMGKKSSTQISVPRNGLISKGLIYAPEHGKLAFTVPGMADYISRNPDDAAWAL